MSKVKFAAWGTVMALSMGLLSACGGNDSSNDSKASGDGGSGETVELSMTFGATLLGGIQEDLIKEFESSHPNIKIKAESLPDSGIFDTLRTRISSGDVPDMYQINIGHVTTTLAEDNGYLADLSSYESMANYSDSIREATKTAKGTQALFTMGVGVLGLAYNKDLLADVGYNEPPKTWDEFMDLGEKLKAKGIDLFAYGGKDETAIGNVFHWAFGEYAVKDAAFKEAYLNNKVDWTNADYRAMLKEGFERFNELNAYVRTGSFTNDGSFAQQAFAEGDVAIILSGTWESGPLHNLNPDLNLGFMNMPYAPEDQNAYIFIPEDGLAVNAKSPHQEEIKTFLNWLFSKETYAKIQQAKGSFSAMPGVGELDPSYVDVPNWLDTGRVISFANTGPIPSPTWIALGNAAQEYTFKGDLDKVIDKFIAAYDNTKSS
ncbi:ABC transporter substrate-binding protein [Cohnella fermenti]|uniref:Extracellular solute-binding protein n=1 Tax=Cohnella fermenti TaxID=2565925 RepID=A0A4S4BL79_9BACL|nr:extracellular solute-binding protein [Cohnella fermenti]THF75506.1 extracellular solute-binding protein [Cohnella fermenti]